MYVSVTTITKTLWMNLYLILWEGFKEKGDQVRVWLRSVEGCGSYGQKISQTGDCFAFAGSCTLSEYFVSSCYMISTANSSRILRFLPRTDRDFIQFLPPKIYSLGHKNEQHQSVTTIAFPCSVNGATACRQLLTSSVDTEKYSPDMTS